MLEPQQDEHLEIGVEGALGVIALNRPQAINALTGGMVRAIADQLDAWRHDDGVRAVLFEGRGPRGFCSGGDVRAVRQHILDGAPGEAAAFFADEYRMNGLIAGYRKPVAVLCEGVVMGGGIGIAGHANFRIASASTRFAMPEAAIGFVCDVGVNAILAKAPLHRALLFEMTGLAVGPADALALGLTDCVVAPERLGAVRQSLVGAATQADVEMAFVSVMGGESIDPGEVVLCADADRIRGTLDLADAASILEGLRGLAPDDAVAERISLVLAGRCPTSLEAIVQSHVAARRLGHIEAILALDLRLAHLLWRCRDFAEGVRAVLVDKTGQGDWSPQSIEDVAAAEIAATIQEVKAPDYRALSTS